jgi:transcriptional regulator with XRE-family HTH domain
VSDQVRQHIRDSGMTQKAFSDALGIDPATLCRFMSGEQGLRMIVLDRVCDYLGLELVQTRRSRRGRQGG